MVVLRALLAPFLTASILMLACSRTSPNRPANEPYPHYAHDREVARHAGEATVHAGQFDPTADGTFVPCDGPRGQCWQPTENPTAPHAEQAAQHRAEAESARKAAGWPRSAEEILCKGIPLAARSASPLDASEVTDVRALMDASSPESKQKLAGARLEIRSEMDAQTLQQRIDCHVEHVSTRLDRYVGRGTDPLVVPGAASRINESDGEMVLEIRAPDEGRAREVLRRAQAMASGRRDR